MKNCELPPPMCKPQNPFLIERGIFSSVYNLEPIGDFFELKYQVFANIVVGRETPHKYDSKPPQSKSIEVLLFEVRGKTIEDSFVIANDILSGIDD